MSVDVILTSAGSADIVAVGGLDVLSPSEGPPGPPGPPASQDIGWGPLTGAFAAGEALNTPPLPHAATYGAIYAHTDSGVAATQTLTIEQRRAGAVIASVTLALNPGDHDVAQAISSLTAIAADVMTLVMPSPADSQLTDLTISLGSNP